MKAKLIIWILVLIVLAGVAAGAVLLFTTPSDTGRGVKIAYICKQASNSWFQEVIAGIGDECKKYNIEYVVYDADFDDEKCIEYVDDAINWGADGILICTTNQDLGPEIAQKCERAGVLIVTIDDTMLSSAGEQLPHIGMATTELCTMGGTALAKLAKENGFFDSPNNVVRVLQIDVPTLTVFGERLTGYRQALISQTPLTEDDFIVIDSPTGMFNENFPVARETVEQYKDVTHWIITGGNDDSAIAMLYALREMGVPDERIIACGLGPSARELVEKEFSTGNKNYISIAAQPQLEGQTGVDMVYEKITNSVELKTMTVIGGQVMTCDNYKMFFEN